MAAHASEQSACPDGRRRGPDRRPGLTLTAPAATATTAVPPRAPLPPRAPPRVAAAGPRGVQAKAAAIAVAVTGRVLWSRDLNTELPMASITKVMTALVVIRAGDLSRKITVPSAALSYVDDLRRQQCGPVGGGHPDRRLSCWRPCCCPRGPMPPTRWPRCMASTRAFIAKMNATARLLGMTRTHFANFDGLPWPTEYSTYSTPASLIKLGRAAMSSAVFRSVVAHRSWPITASREHHAYDWRSLNPLLGVYRGAIGIKTGFTLTAGHCLLFEATRDGQSFIGVNLDSPGVGTTVNGDDATRTTTWAFSLHS